MRIFLGGPPGAGKSHMASYLTREKGWHSLDMDNNGVNPVLQLLDAPENHEAFVPEPLVVEGGFLETASLFQEMITRHGLITFWLTGTFEQLRDSRSSRNDWWDRRENLESENWFHLVERHRKNVSWDSTILMWHADNSRKTSEEVLGEILNYGKMG